MSDENTNAGNQYDRPNQEAVRTADNDNLPDVPNPDPEPDPDPEPEPE